MQMWRLQQIPLSSSVLLHVFPYIFTVPLLLYFQGQGISTQLVLCKDV